MMVNANNQFRVIGNQEDVLTGAPTKRAVDEQHGEDRSQVRAVELNGTLPPLGNACSPVNGGNEQIALALGRRG